MRRSLALLALLVPSALVTPAPAGAQPVVVAPGVSLETRSDGRQVLHVLRVRQTALTRVVPILTSGTPARRARLTAAVTALGPQGAVAGVNGDFFNVRQAYPSGLLLTGGELVSEPEPTRSALLLGADGRIRIPRLQLSGRYQAVDASGAPLPLRTIHGVNRPAERGGETILYTPRFGPATPVPSSNSRFEAAVQLDPGQLPLVNAPLSGTVVGAAAGGGMPIGTGQIVVSGVGSAGATVARELVPGRRLALQLDIPALPPGTLEGIGGGPLLVSAGVPIANAGEGFSRAQLAARTSRSAVGQRADGMLLLVTAEGPAQGSPGLTVAEQAELMARLGAVDAMGLDAGGSAVMVVDGRLVIPWSSERQITTALAVFHRGVSLAPLSADRVSPNGDRTGDVAVTLLRTPAAGQVTVTLVRRGGAEAGRVLSEPVAPGVRRLVVNPEALGVPDGPYSLVARLVPADGSPPTEHRRTLVVDRTLGSLRLRPVRRGRLREVAIGFRLARPARVTVRISRPSGRALRTLVAGRRLPRGRHVIRWDRTVRGHPVAGTCVVGVEARTVLGRASLSRAVVLRR